MTQLKTIWYKLIKFKNILFLFKLKILRVLMKNLARMDQIQKI
jgi:hypothetical protein